MSVLVKGMKMPKCCAECDIEDSFYACPVLREGTDYVRNSGRLDDCTLVEIPENHGRIIDEDEIIIPSLTSWADQVMVADAIQDAPTVIKAEGAEE